MTLLSCRHVDFVTIAQKAVRHRMIERGWCGSFINKQMNRVKKRFAWAAGEELVAPAVYQDLTTVDGLCEGRSKARGQGAT